MNKKTAKALEQSIEHWKRMAKGERNDHEMPSADDCALCGLFNKTNNPCKGCPVMKHTGQDSCEGTPYYAAHIAWVRHGVDSDEFKKAAKKELKFLKGLRDDA